MQFIHNRAFIIVFISTLLIFSGCGESETPAEKAMPKKSATQPESTVSSSSEGSERAPGVVYQEEIYKNWPYQ